MSLICCSVRFTKRSRSLSLAQRGTFSSPPQIASSHCAGSISVGPERMAVSSPSSSATSMMVPSTAYFDRISSSHSTSLSFRGPVFINRLIVVKNGAYSSGNSERKPPGYSRFRLRSVSAISRKASGESGSRGRGKQSSPHRPRIVAAAAVTRRLPPYFL